MKSWCTARIELVGVLALLLAGLSVDAAAQRPVEGVQPRIGLVLSGGGARGAAHLGVLKVLEELRVPVHVLVGTSAGSIVGAAYASGMPVKDIEREMSGLRTADLFRDIVRADTPLRRKADDEINFIGPEIGLGPDGVQLPKGAISGVSLEAVLRRLTARQRTENFDGLPIRFRAVATDVATSEMVVLDHGSLSDAVRASMALPAAVNPVQIEGRLLVDGGVVRNLPVDVARKLGADVIIAVNIGTPLLQRRQIVSLLSVADQMVRILTARNVAQSLSDLTPRDVLLTPDLGSVTTVDFDRLSEAVAAGEHAARAATQALSTLSVDPASYARFAAARMAAVAAGDDRVDEVRVVGTRHVEPDVVLAAMETRAGQPFDADVADRDLKRIYGRGDFEHVSYRLGDEPGTGRVLTVDVAEKSWGPHYLRFGLALSTDFTGNAYFNAAASHRWTWLNHLGAEWRNDVQIGQTERLRSEWYQPLSAAQRWFVSGWGKYERQPFDLYDNGERLVRVKLKQALLGLDLGVPLGTQGEVRLGLLHGRTRFSSEVGGVPRGDLPSARVGALTAQLRVDALDSLRFPRSGYLADVKLQRSLPSLGASTAYSKLSVDLRGAYSLCRHTLRLGLGGAGALGGQQDLPAHELSWLGGFLQLSGHNTGEFVGRGMRFGRVIYTYQLRSAGLLEGVFAGVSAEAGRIGDTVRGPNTAGTLHGNAIFLGVDTPLGPLYLGYGRASSSAQAVYLFLGQP
ncbi:patatin-like phospholipase family protein [Roseateles asaccharophilus]|uniref:NTE family protein n=1 Tax=Roseateles asaccharophilus TaxID=582607 RepID=A0ABU2AFQ9_9BURK|nr:patatin-like phospholipase family protein [Roseateles asaccharophilus]MDR7336061.1 NTE family protein [Roseateles asaccharophilus]